jgi:hypothetical protein
MCDGFINLIDIQEQIVKKDHMDEHASKRKHFEYELKPSKVLPAVAVISYDQDN